MPMALALGLGARPLARPEPEPPPREPPAALRCSSQICECSWGARWQGGSLGAQRQGVGCCGES